MNTTPSQILDPERAYRLPALLDQKHQVIIRYADKVVTISASAIAVIAAFIDSDSIDRSRIVSAAAACFCAAVVIGTLTHLAEMEAINKIIGQIVDSGNIKNHKTSRWLHYVLAAMFICFVAGFSLLAAFSIL